MGHPILTAHSPHLEKKEVIKALVEAIKPGRTLCFVWVNEPDGEATCEGVGMHGAHGVPNAELYGSRASGYELICNYGVKSRVLGNGKTVRMPERVFSVPVRSILWIEARAEEGCKCFEEQWEAMKNRVHDDPEPDEEGYSYRPIHER